MEKIENQDVLKHGILKVWEGIEKKVITVPEIIGVLRSTKMLQIVICEVPLQE